MRRRTLAIIIALPTVAAGIALASGSTGYSFATVSSEATAAAAADQVWSALGHFHALREKLASILEHGYLKSPEMIIGVGTALTFPLVAIGSLAARFMMRWRRRAPSSLRKTTRSPNGGPLPQFLDRRRPQGA